MVTFRKLCRIVCAARQVLPKEYTGFQKSTSLIYHSSTLYHSIPLPFFISLDILKKFDLLYWGSQHPFTKNSAELSRLIRQHNIRKEEVMCHLILSPSLQKPSCWLDSSCCRQSLDEWYIYVPTGSYSSVSWRNLTSVVILLQCHLLHFQRRILQTHIWHTHEVSSIRCCS